MSEDTLDILDAVNSGVSDIVRIPRGEELMGIFARKSKRGPLGSRIHFSWARRRPWWLSFIPRVSISAGPR